MRIASILQALVVVLGFVNEAGAFNAWINCNRSVEVGGYRFGFADWSAGDWEPSTPWTMMYAGPIGEWSVPFSATQGLVGFCLIVLTLIALLATFTMRWKRKWAVGSS
jgi:hypothetical protein